MFLLGTTRNFFSKLTLQPTHFYFKHTRLYRNESRFSYNEPTHYSEKESKPSRYWSKDEYQIAKPAAYYNEKESKPSRYWSKDEYQTTTKPAAYCNEQESKSSHYWPRDEYHITTTKPAIPATAYYNEKESKFSRYWSKEEYHLTTVKPNTNDKNNRIKRGPPQKYSNFENRHKRNPDIYPSAEEIQERMRNPELYPSEEEILERMERKRKSQLHRTNSRAYEPPGSENYSTSIDETTRSRSFTRNKNSFDHVSEQENWKYDDQLRRVARKDVARKDDFEVSNSNPHLEKVEWTEMFPAIQRYENSQLDSDNYSSTSTSSTGRRNYEQRVPSYSQPRLTKVEWEDSKSSLTRVNRRHDFGLLRDSNRYMDEEDIKNELDYLYTQLKKEERTEMQEDYLRNLKPLLEEERADMPEDYLKHLKPRVNDIDRDIFPLSANLKISIYTRQANTENDPALMYEVFLQIKSKENEKTSSKILNEDKEQEGTNEPFNEHEEQQEKAIEVSNNNNNQEPPKIDLKEEEPMKKISLFYNANEKEIEFEYMEEEQEKSFVRQNYHYQGPPLPELAIEDDKMNITFNVMIGCLARNRWLDEAIEVFNFSLEYYNLQIEQKTVYVLIDHLLNHQFAIMRQEALHNQKGEDPQYAMREKEKPSKNVFKRILTVWNKIRKSGVEPDASSYGRMLFGIAWKDPFHAKYILLNMIAAGHKPIQRDLDRVINNLIGSGSLQDYKDVLEAVKSVNMIPSANVLGNLVHESNRFKKLEFLNLFYKEMVKSESYPIDPASQSYLDLINESIAKDQIHQALNLYNIMRSEGLCPHPVVTLTVFEGLYTKKSMLVAARELAETFPLSNMPKLPEILHYIVAGFVWHSKRYVAYRITKLFLQQKIMPLRYTIDVIGNAYLDRNMPYRAEPYFASLLRAKNQEPHAEQVGRLMTSLFHRKDYIRVTRWLPRLEAIPGVRENTVSMLALLLGYTLVGTSEEIVKAWNDLSYLPCQNKKLRVAVVAICNGLSRLDDLNVLKKQWAIFMKSQTLRLDEQQYRHYISILCSEFNDPDEAMRVLVEHMSEKNVPPEEETIQVIAINLKRDGRSHREILEIMEPVREMWPFEYNKWLDWQITHLDKL